jgi:hypothetical protein
MDVELRNFPYGGVGDKTMCEESVPRRMGISERK